MNGYQLRKSSLFEEIGYLRLKYLLNKYTVPRAKIRQLLISKDLIRVKKGLYVFGDEIRQGPYCSEHLANLVYGPSAISLEYALSFYGLIPERVEEITSITLRRNKYFQSPIGNFSYRYLSPLKYSYGITQVDIAGRNVLIATPEKAICDIIYLNNVAIDSVYAMESCLYEDLRIEPEEFNKLNLLMFQKLAEIYQYSSLKFLINFIQKLKEK